MGLKAFLLLALASATLKQRQHSAESLSGVKVHTKAKMYFLGSAYVAEDPNMPGVEGKTRPAEGLPEQGFKGVKVTHTNTKTATSDFAAEYGPAVAPPQKSSAMVAAAVALLALNA